jgi:lysophospholipase L1-like esterase
MGEIDAYLGDDQTWTMNIYRTRQARGGEKLKEYSWSVMNTNDFHSVMDFGTVEGVNVAAVEGGVSRRRAKPAPKPRTYERGNEAGGVTVYRKIDFEDGLEGFGASGKARVELTDDSAGGKALLCVCEGKGAGPGLGFDIAGSKGLRLAFLAKAKGFPRAYLNVHDVRANDNTTSYAYRFLPDGRWTPVVYHLDRFRYNSSMKGFVSAATLYDGVRFFGPAPAGETTMTLDNVVIYRGSDRQPPEAVGDMEIRDHEDGIELVWSPGRDNVAVMCYVVSRSRDGGPFEKVAEVHAPRFVDRTAGTRRIGYRVLACDYEENLGPWSLSETVIDAPPRTVPVEPTQEESDRIGYAAHVREVHERGKGKVRRGHVCFFGDSLTHATSYPRLCEGALGIYTAEGRGYPSMKTSFGRSKVGQILEEQNPEFLMVIYGTNNLPGRRNLTDADLEPWMADMEAIAKAGEARGTVVLFGTVPPRGFKDPESKPEKIYNEALAAHGRKIGVPVAYIFRDIQAAGDRRRLISGDGVHWTGAGMEVAAKAWAKAMEQVQWVLRDRP